MLWLSVLVCLTCSAFFFIFFYCLSTCLRLYLCPDLCRMYTEAHVSVGCFRRRAGPAGQTTEEIPQAHMELDGPVWTSKGRFFSSLSSEGALEDGRVRSDNEGRIGIVRKMGGWKKGEGKMKGKTERGMQRSREIRARTASLVYIISSSSHAAADWKLVWNYSESVFQESVIPLPGQLSVHLRCVEVWGYAACHIYRGARVPQSTQRPPTHKRDGSQLLSQDELLLFVFSVSTTKGQMYVTGS